MPEFSPQLPERSTSNVNMKIVGSQKGLVRNILKYGGIDAYYRVGRKRLPAELKRSIRTVVNAYRPPKDEDDPLRLYPDSHAAEMGLTIGSTLGIRIVPRAYREQLCTRAVGSLNALSALEDSGHDLTDILRAGSKMVLPGLDPVIAIREVDPTQPIEERRNEIYANAVGYMASMGVIILIENELRNLYSPETLAADTLKSDLDWITSAPDITPEDFM